MSADTPPTTTTAQDPATGSQGNDVVTQYLSDVPEELRPLVEPKFREMSGNFDAKFREAAEFRKQWEPFSQVEGLNELDPESLSALVNLHQIAQDDEQFTEWIKAAAQEVGWEPEVDEEKWAAIGQENGWLDGDEGGEDEESGLLQKVEEMLDARLGPISEHVQQQQQQVGVKEAEQQLVSQLEAVKEAAGESWTPEIEAEVKSLAMLHIEEDDPMAAAFEHLTRLQGGAQADLLDEKLSQRNGATLEGGRPDTSIPHARLGDSSLKDSARARFAASS